MAETDFSQIRQIAEFLKDYMTHGEIERAADTANISVSQAKGFLRRKAVKERLAAMQSDAERRAFVTEAEIVARWANVADGNVFDYLDLPESSRPGRVDVGNIRLRDVGKMPRHMQQRVKSFKVRRTENAHGITVNFEIDIHDPMTANQKLAEYLGIGSTPSEDPKTFARSLTDFISEMQEIENVSGGEFPA
jgi:hypothetical protein